SSMEVSLVRPAGASSSAGASVWCAEQPATPEVTSARLATAAGRSARISESKDAAGCMRTRGWSPSTFAPRGDDSLCQDNTGGWPERGAASEALGPVVEPAPLRVRVV